MDKYNKWLVVDGNSIKKQLDRLVPPVESFLKRETGIVPSADHVFDSFMGYCFDNGLTGEQEITLTESDIIEIAHKVEKKHKKQLQNMRGGNNTANIPQNIERAIHQMAIERVINTVRDKKQCGKVLDRYLHLKNEYPNKTDNKLFEGEPDFKGIIELMSEKKRGKFYKWLKKLKTEIKKLSKARQS